MYVYIYTHSYIYIHVNNHHLQELQDGPGIIGFSTWRWLKRTVIHPDLIAISCMNVKFSEDIS